MGTSSCRRQANEMVGGLSDRGGDWEKDWDKAVEVDWDELRVEVGWDEGTDVVGWDEGTEEVGGDEATEEVG